MNRRHTELTQNTFYLFCSVWNVPTTLTLLFMISRIVYPSRFFFFFFTIDNSTKSLVHLISFSSKDGVLYPNSMSREFMEKAGMS